MLANDLLSIWLRCGWLEVVGKWQFKCEAMTCWTFCEPNSAMGSDIPLFCYALPTDSCLWILLHLFAADLLYSPYAWLKLNYVLNLLFEVSSSACTETCRDINEVLHDASADSWFFWCLCRRAFVLTCKPQRSLMTGVHVWISQQCKNSCKTSYESNQTGDESNQTEFIPGLSGPTTRSVRTRGKVVQRKMGHEST